MARNKKGKKKKTGTNDDQEDNYKSAPHSFVFQRGHVGKNIKQLVHDTRVVMEPFTAKNLQVRKKNVLKDFVGVAGMLHVSHFIMYTKTDSSINMRLCRLPRGPTLTFKVHNYCLNGDVISSLRKPNLEQIQYLHHPLLVMNNFSGDSLHIKLMSTMFQNMFPSINVHKVKLNDVKRCVLVSYNPETKMVDFRHYNIRVVPVGMSRGVKKLIQAKVPNLGKYHDISEYVNRAGYSSESEVELDGDVNEVVLPQNIKSRGNIKSSKSAVRLTELGPRLTLQLIKIEEGICDGPVMFHEYVHKTEEELATQKAKRNKKKQLKEARKRQQMENIKNKEKNKEDHKQKSLEGIKRKQAEEADDDDEVENPELSAEEDEDDDVEYYKQEVGRMPDADSFIKGGNKRKWNQSGSNQGFKKKKFDKDFKSGKPSQAFKSKGNQQTDKRKPAVGERHQQDSKGNQKYGDKKSPFRKNRTDNEKKPGSKYTDKFGKQNKSSDGKGKKKRGEMTIFDQIKEKKKRKMKIKEKKLNKFKK